MKSSLLTAAAAVVVAGAAVLVSGTAADAATVWNVGPGQSIQSAIDAAQPGDTISVAAGTYHEAVAITKDRITLRGAGTSASGTVLVPPATFPATICGNRKIGVCFKGTVEGNDGPDSHATAFVTGGRLTGFRIDGFKVGVSLSATDGTQVDNVASVNSTTYGLTDTVSKNSLVEFNTITHSGRSAIYIGNYNIPDANAVFTGNDVSEGAYGISAYDTSGVTVTLNSVRNSCSGFFAFSDSHRIPGGEHFTVSLNSFGTNNANCPGAYGFPEAVQGAGVILVGTTASTVQQNVIAGNTGPDPLSGGIVVASAKKYDAADKIDEGALTIASNVAYANGPADITWDGKGSGVAFSGNRCGTSAPAGLC